MANQILSNNPWESNVRMRIDQLLVERGVFGSRALARAAIEAGLVQAEGALVDKPARMVPVAAKLEATRPFDTVSRAGLKLKAGLEAGAIEPDGWVCLDLGASTGGFSDLLLQRGAKHVYAVEVGHGQLHPDLASHPRLTAFEGLDARALTPAHIPQLVDLLVADLSFIGLAKALPVPLTFLRPGGAFVVLIKPQFEAGPGASKDGVIRDEVLRAKVVAEVTEALEALGLAVKALVPSPVLGGDGNHETLALGIKR